METPNDWTELLCIAREYPLVLHQRQSFTIFPDDPGISLRSAIITAARNFTSYQLRLIIDQYAPPPPDISPDISAYLHDFAILMRQEGNPRLFLLENKPVETKDEAPVLAGLKKLPTPPDDISEKIRIIHDLRTRIIQLLNEHDTGNAFSFYLLCAEYLHLLGTDTLQLFPVQKTLEYAGIHLKQHVLRVDRHSVRCIEWGREFDSYYRKYLEDGYCIQTARNKARKDFMKAHPAPVTDEELLCDYAPPGVSRQSLRKYHQAFLQTGECFETRNGSHV